MKKIQQVSIVFLFLLSLTSRASCPSISLESMEIIDEFHTFVVLKVSPNADLTWGNAFFTISAKSGDIIIDSSTQNVHYSLGVDAFTSFIGLTGYDYKILAQFGCGNSEISFTTNNTFGVQSTSCINVPISKPEKSNISNITSTSIQIGSIPFADCNTGSSQDLYLLYRKKGQPLTAKTILIGHLSENWTYCDYCAAGYRYIGNNWRCHSCYDGYSVDSSLVIGTTNSVVLSGLDPDVEYEAFVFEEIRMTHNWNNNEHNCEVIHQSGSYTSNWDDPLFSLSDRITFKTLGYCNSKNGDYTSPAINNDNSTDFYNDKITSASSITQSSNTHKFIAQTIELKPGFQSNITNSGSFIASAFNPADCATSNVSRNAITSDTNIGIVKDFKIIELPISKAIESKTAELKIYPNPTNGILNVEFSNEAEEINRILITDTSGREVFSSYVKTNTVDISQLTDGVYFYKVSTNKGDYSGKVVKE